MTHHVMVEDVSVGEGGEEEVECMNAHECDSRQRDNLAGKMVSRPSRD